MHLICCRNLFTTCIVTLVVIIIVLQIVHLNLLSQLHMKNSQHNIRHQEASPKEDVKAEIKNLINKAKFSSILDSSGEYNIVNNFIESTLFKESSKHSKIVNDITLTTQGSINHIGNLIKLCLKWPGPISVSVFISKSKISLAAAILHTLHHCFTSIRNQVSFHLVYALNKPVSAETASISYLIEAECEKAVDAALNKASKLFSNQNYNDEAVYPVNLLRNVARKNSWSEFIFLIDIDMYPSPNLYHDFLSFMESKSFYAEQSLQSDVSHNNVYVVPVFEVEESSLLPINKTQLVNLYKKSNVQPFYKDVCYKCQNLTNYQEWLELPQSADFAVAYTIQWKYPYEPFFISSNKVPFYDERFKKYGFNRISQICELHMAKYSFSVLNNAFIIHAGFKTRNSFHKDKHIEHRKNKLLFQAFKDEIGEKYPNSPNKC